VKLPDEGRRHYRLRQLVLHGALAIELHNLVAAGRARQRSAGRIAQALGLAGGVAGLAAARGFARAKQQQATEHAQ